MEELHYRTCGHDGEDEAETSCLSPGNKTCRTLISYNKHALVKCEAEVESVMWREQGL